MTGASAASGVGHGSADDGGPLKPTARRWRLNLDNPEEAAAIIMLANHLLRIADARKKA